MRADATAINTPAERQADAMYLTTCAQPRDRAPAAIFRLIGVNLIHVRYESLSILFTDTGLDRLTDAISTFRASEAQAEAA